MQSNDRVLEKYKRVFMFVFQSFHVVIPGCDLAVIYLSQSLSLEHGEAFENFQESGTKKNVHLNDFDALLTRI